ncbi:MAG: MarR family transcriptional regulator [Solirubrobacteraceae bacterium]
MQREEERAQRLIYAIGRYDTALRNELKRRLRPVSLTIPEFTTLSVLSGRSGLSNAQLARRALVTPQAMNQVLGALEEKGLVRRQASPGSSANGHHRARGARLTAKGARHVQRCERIVDDIEAASFPGMTAAERVAFASLLRVATQRLRDAP